MEYPPFEALKFEKRGPIAIVTFNRPEHRNAMLMHGGHKELEDLWPLLAADKDVKAIVLTGAGDTFSAGGDVKAMAARHGTQEGFEYTLNVPAQTRRMLFGILDVPQPIIAAINGDAVGLGATIAMFADISVMAEDARLGDTHVRVGLVAGDGSTVMWPLLIGPSRAKELLMRARLVDGAEAYRMNLVNHVVPRAAVMDKALELAEELTRMPMRAVQWTKMSVNQGIRHQLNLLLDGAIAFEMLSMNTYDHGEAARAFSEKRRPKFEDR